MRVQSQPIRRELRASVGGALATLAIVLLPAGAGPVLPEHAAWRTRGDESGVRTIAVGRNPFAVAVDERRGRVFVVSLGAVVKPHAAVSQGQGSLSVLDAATGALLRTVPLGQLRFVGGHLDLTVGALPPPQAVAVDERTDRVFLVNASPVDETEGTPTAPGTVLMLDARTGTVLRRVRVGLAPFAVAVDAQTGRAFVANAGTQPVGSVSVLDAATGRLLRTVAMRRGPVSADFGAVLAVDAPSGHVFVLGITSISMLDATTGKLLSTVSVEEEPCAVAADARAGRILVGAGVDRSVEESTNIYLLDAARGTMVSTTSLPAQQTVQTCPLVVDGVTGRAFVVDPPDYQGGLPFVSTFGIQRARLRLLRTVALPTGRTDYALPSLAVDERRGRVIVAAGVDERVRLLDATTGQIVRTVRVGRGPQAVAVDTRRGRVFATNLLSNTVSMFDETAAVGTP